MSIRLDKPWIEFSKQSIDRVTGHLGVYQLANAGKEIIYIGIAGARSRFGLRGELQKWLELDDIATSFSAWKSQWHIKQDMRNYCKFFYMISNDCH